MKEIDKYFEQFRGNIIGADSTFNTCYGNMPLVYADWTASGRLYYPIEKKIIEDFGPFVGNTHSESSMTGSAMTKAYAIARKLIKQHVNADEHDVIIASGSGMTSVINKLQRILGLKISEKMREYVNLPEAFRPVIFITHMEHHSNHTSWLETISDVVCVRPDENGLVDINNLEGELKKYSNRKYKIGAFTACSNVTGIKTPYHKMAKVMHQHDGICFVDFAASAPYVNINMHPSDPMEKLDGIVYSPHKFLGGPGTPGVLIFDSRLYSNKVPDQPGGGTVDWTNPWGEYKYSSNIEAREDGGTPAFLQTIKAALCIELKNKMGVENILAKEKILTDRLFKELENIHGVHILADNVRDRLAIISFYIEGIHHNLVVKLLNDRFGIQARGGCSCAGTYGHYLLNIDQKKSKEITNQIDKGNFFVKPGWIRLSLHPTMNEQEIDYIANAVREIAKNIKEWEKDYIYVAGINEYKNIKFQGDDEYNVEGWFKL